MPDLELMEPKKDTEKLHNNVNQDSKKCQLSRKDGCQPCRPEIYSVDKNGRREKVLKNKKITYIVNLSTINVYIYIN